MQIFAPLYLGSSLQTLLVKYYNDYLDRQRCRRDRGEDISCDTLDTKYAGLNFKKSQPTKALECLKLSST